MNKKPLLLNKNEKKKTRKSNRKVGKELSQTVKKYSMHIAKNITSFISHQGNAMQILTNMRYTNTYIYIPDIY